MRFLLWLTLASTACASPYDTLLPADPRVWAEDPKITEAIATLTPEEKEILAAYTIRRALTGGPAMTIGDALEAERRQRVDQARRTAEAAALTAQVEAARAEERRKLDAAVTVSIVRFHPRDVNYQAHRYSRDIEIEVAFRNTSDRDIAAVRGDYQFVDSFGAPIKRVSLTYESGVLAGGTAVWEATLDVNQFSAEDMRLWTDPTTVRAVWEPSDVLFADGTLLSIGGR